MDTASLSPLSLYSQLGSDGAPLIVDARRDKAFADDDAMIAGAVRPDRDVKEFAAANARGRPLVVYCVHGHEVSQDAARALANAGYQASFLEGGIEAWRAAGHALQAIEPVKA